MRAAGGPGWARRAALALSALALAGCQLRLGLLDPAGPVAEAQGRHMLTILLWMLPVVLPVFLALPLVAWRWRLRGRGRYTPRWSFSRPIEIAIWGLPILVVAILGWNLGRETLKADPYAPLGAQAPLKVEAIGLEWKWLFVYPELGVASAGALTLPAGRPVELRLTAAKTLQSFLIPSLGGQIYAMPGMSTTFHLQADREGRFPGLNTQYNGEHFARQRFETRVLAPGDFADWAREAKAARPLDRMALGALETPGTLDAPRLYGAVEGDPFAEAMRAARKGAEGSE